MSCHFDLVEERIKRLENVVLGGNAKRTEDDQLLDTLLSISHKLANATSRSEKVSSAMKKADEIRKLSDPLYAESDSLVPEAVKFQFLLAEEEKMKEALNGLQKIESLKTVLDSRPIEAIPNLQSNLGKVTTNQADQQNQMAQLTIETYALLQNYKDIVQSLTQTLAEIDLSVSNLEAKKAPKSK